MIRAAIDPGSRWIAVTVTRDEPGVPLQWVDARPFEVGHEVTYDPPQVRFKQLRPIDGVKVEGPLESYEVTRERILTEADASAAATEIVEYLLGHGVDEVATEHVRHVHGTGAAATNLLKSSGVYTRVADRIEQLGIVVRYVLASTWRARLNPLVKASLAAQGKPTKGVLITRSTGGVLDPVFAEQIAGWPGALSWEKDERSHILDSTGLALACHLPALAARSKGSRGPRVRRAGSGSKARPRGDRARATMGPIDLAKYRATDRARDARYREAERVARVAARGVECTCRPVGEDGKRRGGRCRRTCPAHVAKAPPAVCPGCYRPVAGHRLPLCSA